MKKKSRIKKKKKKNKKSKKVKRQSKKIPLKKKKLNETKNKIKDNNFIKVKSDWQKKALVNKKQYEKNIMNLLNIMNNFGKKREKE